MWPAYINAAAEKAPNADVVHDKFHIASHLNEAVDQVRRQVSRSESKQLRSEGNDCLTGTRQLWLLRERNLDEEQASEFDELKQLHLKRSRAWAMKEHFQAIWTYASPGWANMFFDGWYAWAIRSQTTPMEKKATATSGKHHLLRRRLRHHLGRDDL